MNDKPTIMSLHASDELQRERDRRMQAEDALMREAARTLAEQERVDVLEAHIDELNGDVAYWRKRARDAERRGDTWFALVVGGAIIGVGLLAALLVVKAWRAAG